MTDVGLPSDDEWRELFSVFPPGTAEAWLGQMREDMDGADPLEKLGRPTPDRFLLRPFYSREDVEDLAGASIPGMQRAWAIRQDISAPDLQLARKQAREALVNGADELGLHLAFTKQEQQGIPVWNQTDMESLLTGIDLRRTTLHLSSNQAATMPLALLLNEIERRGIEPSVVKGSVELDPIGALVRTGSVMLERGIGGLHGAIETVEKTGAPLRVLALDARPFHEAGASAVQEIAFVLATWSEYLARLTERGLPVEQICQRTKLIVPAGTSFFLEIAKLRAFRILLGQVTAAYSSAGEQPEPLPLTAYTSRWDQTLYDPSMNLLRGTTAAMSAMLGGCDTLCVLPFNGVAGTLDDAGLRLARNTSLILRHEVYLDRVRDAVGGSYYVEALTEEVCRKAWALFQDVEARGGLIACLRAGFIQEQVHATRSQREAGLAEGTRVLVGTSKYLNPKEDLAIEAIRAEYALLNEPGDVEELRAALQQEIDIQDLPHSSVQGVLESVDPLPSGRAAEAVERMQREKANLVMSSPTQEKV